MKLWNELKERMMAHPNSKVREKGCEMTYEELVIYVEALAKYLTGECYGILCTSEMNCAISLLSCFAAGKTAVPLSIRYGEKHCRKIIDTIGMPYMLSDVKSGIHTVDIDMGKYVVPHEHPALILCTSGTSGNPKGVMLSEDNLLTNVEDICEYFDVNENDTTLIARPLYHSGVLTGEFLTSLFKGADIVFCSEQFNPLSLIEMIKKEGITVMGGTPTLLSTVSSFVKKDEELPLRTIAISGECMTEAAAKKIQKAFSKAKIYSVYGLTEASPRVSYLPPDLFLKHPTSVGIPIKSVRMKIVDECDNELPDNEVGELLVTGDNVMIGYYCDNAKTYKVKRNGWLHTGDLAYKDKNGLYYIKGRKDNMIIRSGMNIYPQEIENALLKDRRVKDVLAYGITKNGITQIGLKIKGEFNDVKEVRKLCIELLPSYQIPNHIEIVDEIPKNGSGKKLRK